MSDLPPLISAQAVFVKNWWLVKHDRYGLMLSCWDANENTFVNTTTAHSYAVAGKELYVLVCNVYSSQLFWIRLKYNGRISFENALVWVRRT